MPEDAIQLSEVEDEDGDDSDVTIKTLAKSIAGDEFPDGVASRPSRALMSITAAESMAGSPMGTDKSKASAEGGRGKRKKFKNVMYKKDFWRHNDNDASDVEEGG